MGGDVRLVNVTPGPSTGQYTLQSSDGSHSAVFDPVNANFGFVTRYGQYVRLDPAKPVNEERLKAMLSQFEIVCVLAEYLPPRIPAFTQA